MELTRQEHQPTLKLDEAVISWFLTHNQYLNLYFRFVQRLAYFDTSATRLNIAHLFDPAKRIFAETPSCLMISRVIEQVPMPGFEIVSPLAGGSLSLDHQILSLQPAPKVGHLFLKSVLQPQYIVCFTFAQQIENGHEFGPGDRVRLIQQAAPENIAAVDNVAIIFGDRHQIAARTGIIFHG